MGEKGFPHSLLLLICSPSIRHFATIPNQVVPPPLKPLSQRSVFITYDGLIFSEDAKLSSCLIKSESHLTHGMVHRCSGIFLSEIRYCQMLCYLSVPSAGVFRRGDTKRALCIETLESQLVCVLGAHLGCLRAMHF